MGMETIEPTTDPETDNYPHYYRAADPGGYIHSTLVYADLEPSNARCLASADSLRDDIHIAIEYEDGNGDVEIGVGADLTPEDARRLARSLTMLANRLDPVVP